MRSGRNNGWINGKSRLPCETDGDETGKIFVWHAYQGAMLCRWDHYTRNSFHVYWMPIADTAGKPWMVAAEKMPTKEDADGLSCVFAKDIRGEISVTGWHQFEWNKSLTHWKPLPEPPSDYRELRRME